MILDPTVFEHVAPVAVRIAAFLALALAGVVVVERASFGFAEWRRHRFEGRYQALVRGALSGDDEAIRALVDSPGRHRLRIAALLIAPLVDDRDPARIARTREIVRVMSLMPVAERLLRSRMWWRRTVALRALGLLQATDYTASLIAGLDDPHADVRAAALDALADMRNPASLQAIVVRLLDSTLHRGRRIAAFAAFGPDAEPFLLELARFHDEYRFYYARGLAICGTERSRPTLCGWAADPRPELRVAVFEALAHIGLDDRSAALAIAALEDADETVRATAARALQGWTGSTEATAGLVRHLDDTWIVAIRAARSLQSTAAGLGVLQGTSSRSDLAGLLARQMIWEAGLSC